MINAVRQPESIVLLGGTSEIGLAIVRALPTERLKRVVLSGRPSPRLDSARVKLAGELGGISVETVAFDADDVDTHEQVLADIAKGGDLDVVIVAFGVLGDQEAINDDPTLALPLIHTNFVGGASAVLQSAQRLKLQGHGSIIVLSSVAGDRGRASNFVYGATKAGLDVLSEGLADSLVDTGVDVLVVRPGFVRSRMTDGMAEAPFATDPTAVGADVAEAWRKQKTLVYSPAILRAVMGTMKSLPRPVFRKVSDR